jgi:hypothetical protein
MGLISSGQCVLARLNLPISDVDRFPRQVFFWQGGKHAKGLFNLHQTSTALHLLQDN